MSTTSEASFFAKAKKAFSGALAAGIVAAAPVVIAESADGFTWPEVIAAVGVFAGAAVIGFFSVFLPANGK